MLCRILTICPFKCFILLSLWLLEIIVIIMCYCDLCLSPCWHQQQKHHQVFAIFSFVSCFVDLFFFIFPVDCLIVPHAVCTVFTQKLCIFRESECESESEREIYLKKDSLKKDALVFRIHFEWACVHCSLLSPQSQFNDYIYRFVWINKSDE